MPAKNLKLTNYINNFLCIIILSLCLPLLLSPVQTNFHTVTIPNGLDSLTDFSLNNFPLQFEPNFGQAEDGVQFQVRSMGGVVSFKPQAINFSLPSEDALSVSNLSLQFAGANPSPEILSMDALPGKINYFIGNNPDNWVSNVPTYSGIIYDQLYPGVTLYYDSSDSVLKGTYLVTAGVDPNIIRWSYTGIESLFVDESSGDLQITLPNGDTLIERAPVAWQNIGDSQIPVTIAYQISTDNSIGFTLGKYQAGYDLVLDPTIEFSRFLGGTGNDVPNDVVVDDFGNIYVIGHTTSTSFLASPMQPHGGTGSLNQGDAFVIKLDPTGQNQLFTTYLGGTADDVGLAIGLDSTNNIYIAGHTVSNDLPTTANAYRTTPVGWTVEPGDAWVARINVDNSNAGTLAYSTYLGSDGSDDIQALAVDEAISGIVYVTGGTRPNNPSTGGFPTTNGFDQIYNGGGDHGDAFITKIDTNQNNAASLLWSSYFGGSGTDHGLEIALTSTQIYIAGQTASTDLPTNSSSFLSAPASGGSIDGFVATLSKNGTSPTAVTYAGGTASGLDIDSSGNVYIAGTSNAGNILGGQIPLVSGFQLDCGRNDASHCANYLPDGFILKLNSMLEGPPLYFSYLGFDQFEQAQGIAVDDSEIAYVIGRSESSAKFVTENATSLMSPGFPSGLTGDAILAQIDTTTAGATSLEFLTLIGGADSEEGYDVAVYDNGVGDSGIIAIGQTHSGSYFENFQPQVNSPNYAGGVNDGFIIKINVEVDTPPPSPPIIPLVARNRLVPETSFQWAEFGRSVDIDGDWAIVGSSSYDTDGTAPYEDGAAYLFHFDGQQWNQIEQLLPPDNVSDGLLMHFGWKVAIEGDWAMVSAVGVENEEGRVYVYKRENGVWSTQYSQELSGTSSDDYFGHSLALSGDTALVGAPLASPPGSVEGEGVVYAYQYNNTTNQWAAHPSQANLPFSNTGTDRFGYEMTLDGNTVFIGANYDDDIATNAGAVYVYTRPNSTGTWSQQQKLKPASLGLNDVFGGRGIAVDVTNGWAFIGADLHDVNGYEDAGAVYIYEKDPNTGTWQLYRNDPLVSPDPGVSERFGFSIALAENTLFIGEVFDGLSTLGSNGAVFRYDLNSVEDNSGNTTLQWIYDNVKLTSPSVGGKFGRWIAIDNDRVLIGEEWGLGLDNTTNTGAAYVFTPNNLPVAVDDEHNTADGFIIDVLTNDTDPDNAFTNPDPARTDNPYHDELTIASYTQPPNGTGTVDLNPDNKTFTYNPEGFCGETEFTYKVQDGHNESQDSATVTIDHTILTVTPEIGDFVVTILADSGPGSLRQAIIDAVGDPDPNRVLFARCGVIEITSPLPPLSTGDTVIDATTASEYNGVPLVTLRDGANVSRGFQVTSANNAILGLQIDSFTIGVEITGVAATDNRLSANYIGADGFPNFIGVKVEDGSNNIIGTDGNGADDATEGNVISGNTGIGIQFNDTTGNVVAGNLIGLAADGNTALANGGAGIQLILSDNNLIGTNGDITSDEFERNIISGNTGAGIQLTSGSDINTIAGNYIGLNEAGTDGRGNGEINGSSRDGIAIFASSGNKIGTNSDGIGDLSEGNVISDNANNGITISNNNSNDTVIAGNLIGTNAAGDAPIPNAFHGIFVSGGSRAIIGADSVTDFNNIPERNVISGNSADGILVLNSYATDTVIGGNLIGLSADGTQDLGNNRNGININASAGITQIEYNVVSGNGSNGIYTNANTTVSNNRVGTNENGDASIPNYNGIAGVGGTIEFNLVSGNNAAGVIVYSGSTTVDQNMIGLSVAGDPLGNDGAGVNISYTSNVVVSNNEIAYNGAEGVFVNGSNSLNNQITQNNIYENGTLGIDLFNSTGVTPNDLGDTDSGTNNLQNFPELSLVSSTGTDTRIAGTLDSPNGSYTLEFFSNTTCDASGYGEGQVYLGNVDGHVGGNFSIDLTLGLTIGHFVTATATDINGNTSEFSECAVVVENTKPFIDQPLEAPPYFEDPVPPPDPINLALFFDDFEDGAENLVYTIEGNTNASLFANIEILIGDTNLIFDFVENGFGTADVTIRATDSGGLDVEDTLTIIVNPVNDVPDIEVDAPNVSVLEGQEAGMTGTVSDIDGDPLDLSASIGSVVDNEDGTWTWTYQSLDGPDDTQTVTISANDGQAISSVNFDLQVDNVAPDVTDAGADQSVDEGDLVNFNGEFEDAGSADTHTFLWEFGDGATANTLAASHTYADNGTYIATLTVTDDDGASHSANTTITVDNVAPDNVDAGTDQTVAEGVLVNFSGSFTDAGSADTHTFLWEFGDGATATTSATSHTYADNGTYTVTLTITDDDNAATSDTAIITVNNVAPDVTDAGADQSVDEGDLVNFSGEFEDAGSADTHTFLWEFGDGATATTLAATHTYADNGTYIATLTVTDDDGASDSANTTISVDNVAPDNVDAGTDQTVAEGDLVNFSGSFADAGSADTHTFLWEFGDGATATTLAASHTYADNGTYTVTFTVTDDDNTATSDTAIITVNNVAPDVTDAGADQSVDEGDLVNFSGSFTDAGSADTHTFLWEFGDGATATTLAASHTYADNGTYTVTLTITDDDNAATSDTAIIIVNNVAPDVTDAGADQSVDEGDLVNFSGEFEDAGSADTHTFLWEFGDGATATTLAATHTYADNGTYIATLTVTDDDGASDSANTTISVDNVAPDNVDAGTDQTVAEGDLVNFSGSFTDAGSADTHTFLWEFGDGATATTLAASHTYADNGTYTVTFTVTDDDNAATSDTAIITVNNVAPDVTDAGADQSVDEGDLVNFSGSFTDAGSADTHTFLWEFGDGATATTLAATHTYADNGTYIATLTVTDDDGASDSANTTISVDNVAPDNVDAGADQTVAEGDLVNFSGSFADAGSADTHTFLWEFGDGATATTLAASHTYADNGTYTVTFTVTDDDNTATSDTAIITVNNVAPDVTDAGADQSVDEGDLVNFSGSFTDAGSADTHTFLWEFGDGATATTLAASHTYADNGTYTVTLTITDDDNAATSDTAIIIVNNVAPDATDAGADQSVDEGDLVNFSGEFEDAGSADTHTFLWEFGDGATATTLAATHTYADNGTYIATLTVTDDDGASDSANTTISVDNVAPDNVDAGTDQTVAEGDLVNFSGSFTDAGSADTHTFLWEFGDGATATTLAASHTYADNGTYTVTFTVTDDDNAATSDTAIITVNNVAPDVTDAGADQSVDEGDLVNFSGSFTDAGSADTHTFLWEFGDGATATTLAATHTYADNGTYIATLTVTDDDGASDSANTTISVDNVAPDNVDAGTDQTVAEGDLVNFSGSFTDAGSADTHTFLWEFGDGATATTLAATHTYADNGTYIATLTVTDDDGASDSANTTISVDNVAPDNVDAGTDQTVAEGDLVNFSGSFTDAGSADTHTFLWEFGDGATATTLAASHTYADNGTYTVTFTVTDDDNTATSDTAIITVNNVAPDNVDAGANRLVLEGDVVNFNGSFNDVGTGDTHTYLWDFGDGTSATALQSSHSYGDNGAYTVVLTVTDDDGEYSSDTATITVTNVEPIIMILDSSIDPNLVNSVVVASAEFVDFGFLDTFTATWDWGDGQVSPQSVPSSTGVISITNSHIYTTPGVYTLSLTVADDDNDSDTATYEYVVVYDPSGGFVTGSGRIASPAGAVTSQPTVTGIARFGFNSRYVQGASLPTGNTRFHFRIANLLFRSTQYEWMVISGKRVQYRGVGTIQGETGTYGFILTAIDGDLFQNSQTDKFRIKIWNTATDELVYDNQLGDNDSADPSTDVIQGNIQIHAP